MLPNMVMVSIPLSKDFPSETNKNQQKLFVIRCL
jgi:hypothetical protein